MTGASTRSRCEPNGPGCELSRERGTFRRGRSPQTNCSGATVSVRGRTARTTLSCPNGCTGSLRLYKGSVNTDPEPLAQADVDPPPGVRTRVTIRLSRSAAATLSKAGRVNVTLFVEATSQYRARSRRVKHG